MMKSIFEMAIGVAAAAVGFSVIPADQVKMTVPAWALGTSIAILVGVTVGCVMHTLLRLEKMHDTLLDIADKVDRSRPS